MTAKLLDGKSVATAIRTEVIAGVQELTARTGVTPALAVIALGDDPAAQTYIRRIQRTFEGTGIAVSVHALATNVSQPDLLALLQRLNHDPKIHGIIVQEPLPAHINPEAVASTIAPHKDVDGASPVNAGLLFQNLGQPFIPPTPAGGLELLLRNGIEIKGARAVVVGRSTIVGRPMAMLLLHRHATVTICHSRTVDLPAICREADILCCAIGKARMITADYVRPGAVVVDFGINFVNGVMVGDVDFAPVAEIAAAITPVPGGTGPVTSAMLMRNTLEAARRITL
jgi:methylenetetrahydrofolate dehydrogenase (NADP+)/methenyltetrahydrofolate cyclohydrolase